MGTPTWTARCLVNLLPETFRSTAVTTFRNSGRRGDVSPHSRETTRALMTLVPENLRMPNGGCDR
jgi:hypothetical protein